MARYKAAIFDVFGTMVDWRSGVAAETGRAFEGKGVELDPFAFADDWRREYDPAMAKVRDGDRGYVALDILHRENLERVLERRGLGGLFSESELANLARAWEKLPAWPDAPEGLRRLNQGMFTAPCSNGSIALMTRLARFAGLNWDCILGAEIAQGYKPDAKVYLASAAALGLAPEEVIMVACHNNDLAAARAAGMPTGYFPRADEWGPGVKTDLAPADDWDVIAEDMEDMASILLSA